MKRQEEKEEGGVNLKWEATQCSMDLISPPRSHGQCCVISYLLLIVSFIPEGGVSLPGSTEL